MILTTGTVMTGKIETNVSNQIEIIGFQRLSGTWSDKEVSAELESDGWRVIRLWEWQIKKHLDECVDMVMQAISERSEI